MEDSLCPRLADPGSDPDCSIHRVGDQISVRHDTHDNMEKPRLFSGKSKRAVLNDPLTNNQTAAHHPLN